MFTAQIGELLPVFSQWVNPNETFKIGYNGKTRTARSQRSDSKISSYQPKRIDSDFEDNLYNFLFHGAKIKKNFCMHQIC